MAPKTSAAVRRAKKIVNTINAPNFLKKVKSQMVSRMPQPIVVMAPLRILTPIYL